MLALVYDGRVALRRDWPRPRAAAGEALIAVRRAGICSTDLEVARGYLGFRGVMGHEFVGVVLDGPARWRGKRVVAEINCPCRRCRLCRRGLGNHCPRRTVVGIRGRDGCFAEFVSVPAPNLHEVPRGVSDDEAVFVEPLAAAMQVLRQVRLSADDRVVVLGDGRLGQLIVRAIRPRCRRVMMVGRHEGKLALAEQAGVRTVALADFSPAGRADVVVEATGSPSGLDLAMRAVRPRGTIVLKSTYAGQRGPNPAPLVIGEVTVVGSRCGALAPAIRALARRQIDVRPLISAEFPLSQAPAAMKAAAEDRNLKVILRVNR